MALTPPLPRLLEETVAIVGVGLIGGSLAAAALKQRRAARRVIGVGRDPQRLQAAQAAGLINEFFTDIAAAARESQLVVVCTPVDRIVEDVRAAAVVISPESLITDAGSVKGAICQSLRDLSGPVTFVGSHPLAGSEKQGFEYASAKLFEQRLCVLTPLANSPAGQVQRLHRFWQSVGMRTQELAPEQHDAMLAMTSHLPHALAAVLAGIVTPDHFPFAATGFRDTTRIAAGDPELWTAILLQNSSAVIHALTTWETEFTSLRTALERGDAASLKKLLQQAKTKRDAMDQSSPALGSD